MSSALSECGAPEDYFRDAEGAFTALLGRVLFGRDDKCDTPGDVVDIA